MLARFIFRPSAVVLAGATLAVLRPGLEPAQKADYHGKFRVEQYEGRHPLRVTLVVLAAGLSILATAALIRLRRAAPTMYFASAVATFVVVELLRPYIHPGAGEEFYEMAIPLSAIVLVLLFFTGIKSWYNPRRPIPERGIAYGVEGLDGTLTPRR